ncbi:MAG: YggT family protein [Clostridium sp.]|nr:YggT family protein [Clostridium sp.]
MRLLITFIRVIELLIFIECILSWVIQDYNNEIMSTLRRITGPILEPFRKLQYRFIGNSMIDISPILAFVTLEIIEKIIYMI